MLYNICPTNSRKCHNPLLVFLWSLQSPPCVILIWKYALCFRLFIQDRVLPLVFTWSPSGRRKEIITAAIRPSVILLSVFLCSWVVCNILNEMLEEFVQTVQTCYMTCFITCYMTCLNGLPWALATLLQKKDTNVHVDWDLFSSSSYLSPKERRVVLIILVILVWVWPVIRLLISMLTSLKLSFLEGKWVIYRQEHKTERNVVELNFKVFGM